MVLPTVVCCKLTGLTSGQDDVNLLGTQILKHNLLNTAISDEGKLVKIEVF